ncbi:hypothetical protein B0T20DRAFT_394597 [Sordaria brevicollis]|uniref:Glucose-methanol-choline oxidoreductase N-terminal domain-containing protein n=1 Tax=Sordaria brevicollis TaxID=83679 RepID=A0AAE0P9Z1_SORBR|nr:hypothetical protein B0T20DRAFT_394597 [Sordaria brevicollis]
MESGGTTTFGNTSRPGAPWGQRHGHQCSNIQRRKSREEIRLDIPNGTTKGSQRPYYGGQTGKVLGGPSPINWLTCNRASAAEYDQWGKVSKSEQNWKSMSAAMTKAENYTCGPARQEQKYLFTPI